MFFSSQAVDVILSAAFSGMFWNLTELNCSIFVKYKRKNGSNFAKHVIQNQHQFGNIEEILEVMHIQNKERKLNILENLEIYKYRKEIINEIIPPRNILFDLINEDNYVS